MLRKHVLAWLALGLLLFASTTFAATAQLHNISIVSIPTKPATTQIIFKLDNTVSFKIFTLQHPDRLAVDFSNTLYTFSAKSLDFKHTAINNLRHGIQNGTDLRVVFDLQQALPFSYTVDTSNGFRVIINLGKNQSLIDEAPAATTPTVTAPVLPAIETKQIESTSAAATPPAATKNISPATPAPATLTYTPILKTPQTSAVVASPTTVAMPPTEVDNEINRQLNSAIENAITNAPKIKHDVIVVIDAGHGGKDPGTIGPGDTQEKNVTIAIARDLQKRVDEQPGMQAVMTRTGDYYVGLRDRLAIAHRDHGDIFIAIHADAYPGSDAAGASVFALSLHGASSEAALRLAQKENYSELGNIDLNGIDDDQDALVRSVLIDLSQTATISASLQLGTDVINQLGKVTELHHGIVEQAPFMVLKSPDIPSILVETGFLSNPNEEARLKSAAYQQKIANALMAGIGQYFNHNPPPGTLFAAQ